MKKLYFCRLFSLFHYLATYFINCWKNFIQKILFIIIIFPKLQNLSLVELILEKTFLEKLIPVKIRQLCKKRRYISRCGIVHENSAYLEIVSDGIRSDHIKSNAFQ